MMKVAILSCLLVVLHHECSAQDCLRPANREDSINFEDQGGSAPRIANGNGAQAIVTGYQFHCCGDIVEWGAHVRPNGGRYQGGAYSINFQVWRPSPTVGSDGAGVYSLVGENRFTSIVFPPGEPVRETPQPTDVISVRPGDVVGFFQFSSEGGNDGIQLEGTSFSYEHLLWYQTAFSQGSLSTLVVGTAGTLISSTNAGIQLTADISSSSCTPLPTPPPTTFPTTDFPTTLSTTDSLAPPPISTTTLPSDSPITYLATSDLLPYPYLLNKTLGVPPDDEVSESSEVVLVVSVVVVVVATTLFLLTAITVIIIILFGKVIIATAANTSSEANGPISLKVNECYITNALINMKDNECYKTADNSRTIAMQQNDCYGTVVNDGATTSTEEKQPLDYDYVLD